METCMEMLDELKQCVKSQPFPPAQHTPTAKHTGWHAGMVLMRGICLVLDRGVERGADVLDY